MLENVNLKRKLPDDEYTRVLPGLQRRLYDLEKTCWDLKIPSVIVFEGWDAAGKGSVIATVTQRLDPRGFKLHVIDLPRPADQNFPWLRRFWMCVPDAGEMAIFDRSWYTRVMEERVEALVPEKLWRNALADIVDFERALADNGTVMLKFFLHISRREQEKRFEKIAADPLEAWRVTKAEWARLKKYDDILRRPRKCWSRPTLMRLRGLWWKPRRGVGLEPRCCGPSSRRWSSVWGRRLRRPRLRSRRRGG